MQDVPISMQALTAQTLQQLNVATFDDYIKTLPNVTTANNGPGQNEVFMRGLSAGSQASQGSASTGLWPNVAIYLDNQSGQLPNRNLDIYAADLNRIEVLEGPQGTLFGAGAEAGVIRYITNEPKLDVTEGNVKGGYGVTEHGDPNTDVTAVLNLPLIAGTMAVRAVLYQDRRGGYIDNVPATFTRKNTDIGIHYADFPAGCADLGAGGAPVCQVPPGSPVINNAGVTGTAINPVSYLGGRVEVLYQFNDDWNALITQSYQDMQADGVFYQQPNASDGAPLQPLEVTLFNPAQDKDRFESTAWTLNGRFGALKAVYTGGYLVRNVDQVGDYTNYARGVYADYYQCYGPLYDASLTSTCFSPRASWHSVERNTHQQHELRVSTPDEWRLRAIAGAFYEDNTLYDQTGWNYKTVPSCSATLTTGCFADVGTFPGTTVVNPGVQGSHTSFYQDTLRETKQTAFFASVDFDLIPKVLTATLGTRHFRFENSLAGSVLSSFLCFEGDVTPGGCHAGDSYNLNAENLRDTESGFKSRGNLTWHITPDVMVYYTFSQGFRPGGFNQNGGAPAWSRPGCGTAVRGSQVVHSDKLTNNEIGWKTEFFNHRLQWNGAVYQENWDNVQIPFFDPGVVGNIFYDTNGQNFRIKGNRDVAGGPGHHWADAAGCGILEPEPADEFAGADRQQSGQPELRQADHASLRRTGTHCRPSPTRSARSARRAPMRRRFSSACARATSGPSTASPRSFNSAPRTAAIPIRRPVRILPSPRPAVHYLQVALRESRLLDLRRLIRRRQGCLVRYRVRRESQQFERQHVRQHRSIHRRADAASTTRHRRDLRLQVLKT